MKTPRQQAIEEIRSKTGPVTLSELKLSFAERIPGLVGMVARSLEVEPAEVKMLCAAGQLTFSDLLEAVEDDRP